MIKHETKKQKIAQAVSSANPLLDFAKKLVTEKNFKGIESEVMEQIETDVYDRLEKHINAFILSAMPAEKLEEFDQILETAKEADIQQFCALNIPELDTKVAQELLNFRQIYLGI